MSSLLTRNSKIKKSAKRTFNFGIPAFRSASGFATCPMAGVCASGCYAQAGAYKFSNVAKVFEARLEATLKADFEDMLIEEAIEVRAERIRIHDSGDFYSAEYLEKWVRIAKAMPNVEFYAYTKSVQMVKDRMKQDWPSNFTIIFSFGGKQDGLIDTTKDRHSCVFETVEELNAAGYADAHEQDDVALGSNPKIGLVYHGNKLYNKTAWNRIAIIKH